MLKRNIKAYFLIIKTVSYLFKQDFNNFFPVTYLTRFTVGTSDFIRAQPEILSHVFCCKFDQDVFKNNYSEKSLNNIKNKGVPDSINC